MTDPLKSLSSLLLAIADLPGKLARSIRDAINTGRDIRADFKVDSLEAVSSDLTALRFEPHGLRASMRAFFESPSVRGVEAIRDRIKESHIIVHRLTQSLDGNTYIGARERDLMDVMRAARDDKLTMLARIGGEPALNRYITGAEKLTGEKRKKEARERKRTANQLEHAFDETNRSIDAARKSIAKFLKAHDQKR